MDTSEKIGDRIRQLRQAKKMTQSDLAAEINLSDKAISKWESGEGFPNLEALTQLAQLFDTTTDYLLMGKTKDDFDYSQISRLEMIAKKDDPTLLDDIEAKDKGSINLYTTDETGHPFIDYLFQYQSKKVFQWLMNKKRVQGYGSPYFRGAEDNYYDKLAELLILTDTWENFTISGDAGLRDLACKQAEKAFEYSIPVENFVLSEDFLSQIGSPSFANKEGLMKVISSQSKTWYGINTWLLEKAYLLGNKKIAFYIADVYINLIKTVSQEKQHPQAGHNFLERQGLSWVTEIAFKKALSDNDEEAIQKFYSLNKLARIGCETYLPDEYDLRMAKVTHDSTLSGEEKLIQSVTHNGYPCVKELIQLKNYNLYQKIITKPCCLLEDCWNEYKAGNISKAKELAPKACFPEILKSLENGNPENVIKAFCAAIYSRFNTREYHNNDDLLPNYDRYFGDYHDCYSSRAGWVTAPEVFFERKRRIWLDEIWSFGDLRFYQDAIKQKPQDIDDYLERALKEKPENYALQQLLLDSGAQLHHRWVTDAGYEDEVRHDEPDLVATQLLKNQLNILIQCQKKAN